MIDDKVRRAVDSLKKETEAKKVDDKAKK